MKVLLAATSLVSLLVAAPAVGELLPDSARGEAAEEGGEFRVAAELHVDSAAVAVGEPFRVGVRFELDPEWHIYWRNPGQAAYSTELTFEGSGAQFGELQWPAPQVFTTGDGFITTYGYDEEVLLFADATITEGSGESALIEAVADFLVCKIDCIPGRIEMSREVVLGPVSEPAAAQTLALFDQYAAIVPRPAAELGWSTEFATAHSPLRVGETVDAALAVAACEDEGQGVVCNGLRPSGTEPREYFIPDVMPQLGVEVLGAEPHPLAADGTIVRLRLAGGPDAVEAEQRFRGVLRVEDAEGSAVFVEIDEPLRRGAADAAIEASSSGLFAEPSTPPPSASASPSAGMSIWHAIWLALLGGLLLNLMPCVLPVLALKAASLATLAHEPVSHRARHAGGYATGVVGSMLVLALAVIGLRVAGAGVGWGFQFQNPGFVAAVVVLCVVFALELFGVFEIGVNATKLDEASRKTSGVTRSVFEGVLAVVLATPCSAPFMAGAVGFALAAPWPVIVGVFVALGVGLASPYVLLAVTPGAARLMPRPGLWMEDLKRVLGFVMLGAALWLLQVAIGVAGEQAMWRVGAVALVASLGAWAWGETQRRRPERGLVALSLAAVVTAGSAAVLWRFEAPSAPATPEQGGAVEWIDYSPDALASELAAGRVVFVDYTADWCITCKFNERTVITVEPAISVFRELDVAVMRADWTRRDDVIRADLARFGKAGVPMYLVYSPNNPDSPSVLPELLTASVLEEALRAAAP